MWEYDSIPHYLETVASQIRWRRARSMVTWELEQHIEDQREAFAAEGHTNAQQMALTEMGDPVALGKELDRVHRPVPQYGLLALTILLALSGAILRIWLTADWAHYDKNLDPGKTLLAFAIGCVALLFGYFLDVSWLGFQGKTVYLCVLVAGVVALVVSPRAGGVPYYARYIVLCYPVAYAFWLYTCRQRGWLGLVLSIAGGIPLAGICMLVPSLFGLVTLLASGFVLLMVAAENDWFALGRRKSLLAVTILTVFLAGTVCFRFFSSDHILLRWNAAIHPEQDTSGMGYQAYIIKKALNISRWFGEGSWSPDISFAEAVPGCESDALLTTLIYKAGWLSFGMVMILFAALMGLLIHRCLQHTSRLGTVVALAVAITLLTQAFCSVAWNLGFTVLSASFPMVTGNVNTILNMWLLGLALSIFRGERIAWEHTGRETLRIPRYRIKILIQKA